MIFQNWVYSLLGGILIGLSVSLMLFWNGRVTGISGIVSGLLSPLKGDVLWRVFFLMGLFAGGLFLNNFYPQAFENTLHRSFRELVVAGFLVGWGTVMGSGCTSGHGVCGIARFSLRSIVATLCFMISGAMTVILLRWIGEI
jgi:uncharacterized membrane protein YedE/YeeE